MNNAIHRVAHAAVNVNEMVDMAITSWLLKACRPLADLILRPVGVRVDAEKYAAYGRVVMGQRRYSHRTLHRVIDGEINGAEFVEIVNDEDRIKERFDALMATFEEVWDA